MGTVTVMDTLTEREIRMWWIRQRKISLGKNGFFRGFYDCHSHLLPGVDDGLQQMEQSLELLAELEEAGVACLWLTPHVAEDMPNTTAALEERFGLLKERYRGRMALRLAAEYMLDAGFSERLEKRDLLTLGQRRVLVETSFAGAPYNFWSLLDQIKEAGYSPVLAHPEQGGIRQAKEKQYRFAIEPAFAGRILWQGGLPEGRASAQRGILSACRLRYPFPFVLAQAVGHRTVAQDSCRSGCFGAE